MAGSVEHTERSRSGAYFEAWDPSQRLSVWLVSGVMDAADWQENIDTMLRLDAEGCESTVLVVDNGARPPDVVWRKRISQTVSELKRRRVFALVTTSLPIRGALTALNWFRPFSVPTEAFPRLDDAAAFLARHTGRQPNLQPIVDELRARATIAQTRTRPR